MGATAALAPPSDPNAAGALWSDLLLLAFNLASMAALLGLFSRRSWGFGVSGLASVVGMGVAVACAVTDHHLGVYWAYELAGFTALGLASGFARLHA